MFDEYKQKVASFIGRPAMEKLLSGALFSLTFGGNDYINNYLMPSARSNKQFTLPQWQSILIAQYKIQLIVSWNPTFCFCLIKETSFISVISPHFESYILVFLDQRYNIFHLISPYWNLRFCFCWIKATYIFDLSDLTLLESHICFSSFCQRHIYL